MDIISKSHDDIVLLFVGQGKARIMLEKLVEKLGLHEQVLITGPVNYEDIPNYLAFANVGILPFPPLLWWRVSSPIKLMEYLAMAKPVIVTDIEAHRDVLRDCPAGTFITSNKPEEIAQGILKVYRSHKLHVFEKKGRELVRRKYTWDIQVSHLEKYLRSIIQND
jgi:glycosyltransferase involved in cell wall biosynthesis